MTLFSMALKNLRHQAQRYVAFYLSSAFAVWLFFLYGSLLTHPELAEQTLPPMARETLLGVESVVALFAYLFTAQSHEAFLRARQKDLSVLLLLGMTPRRLALLVACENLLVGLGAILTGIALGAVSSKLFFLGTALALDLEQPLSFHFSPLAAGITAGVFAVIFALVAVRGLRQIRRTSVAELMRTSHRPQPGQAPSLLLSALGIACLAGAYSLGLGAGTDLPASWILPLIGAILLGTYLLFAQVSGVLLRQFRARRALYWRGARFLAVAQFGQKLRSNVRVLFMVSILSTVVLVAVGVNWSGLAMARASAARYAPVGLMVEGEPNGLNPQKVASVMGQNGITVTGTAQIPVLRGAVLRPDGQPDPVVIVSQSGLRSWMRGVLHQDPPAAAGDGAVLAGWGRTLPVPPGQVTLDLIVGDRTLQLPLTHRLDMIAFNQVNQVILPDSLFDQLQGAHGAAHGLTLHGYGFERWEESGPALEALARETGALRSLLRPPFPGMPAGPLIGTHSFFATQRSLNALGLSMSGFVAILFFLAAGQMLYFKLFTDLQDDRRQYRALGRLGVGPNEVRRAVGAQILLLFFAPLLVALAHASLIQALFAGIVEVDLAAPAAAVAVAYTLLQSVYGLLARRAYIRALLA